MIGWLLALLAALPAHADALSDLGLAPTPEGQAVPNSVVIEIGAQGSCPACTAWRHDRPDLAPSKVLSLDLDTANAASRARLQALLGNQINDVTQIPYFATFTIDSKGQLHKTGRLLGYQRACFAEWSTGRALATVPQAHAAMHAGLKVLETAADGCGKHQGGSTAVNEGYESDQCPGAHRVPIAPFCDSSSLAARVAPACDALALQSRAQAAIQAPEQLRAIGCYYDHRFNMDAWKRYPIRKGLTRGTGSGESMMVEQLVGDVAQSGKPGRERLLAQLGALRAIDPELDPSLVIATAYRESDNSILSTKAVIHDSFYGGGLDFMAEHLPVLRARNYLPPGYGKNWVPSGNATNENGNTAHPTTLPDNEQVVAYGADLRYMRDLFRDNALKAGFTQADLDALTPEAKRVWTQLFFMGNAGYVYTPGPKPPGVKRVPGGRTILTHLKYLIDHHEAGATSLNDVVNLPKLTHYEIVRRALISLSDAEMLDRVLNVQPGGCAGG